VEKLCKGGQGPISGCCAIKKEEEGTMEDKYINKKICNATE